MMDRFEDYLNVLYIIECSENSVKEIQAIDPIEIADQVSFLNLKKNVSKVWF